MYDDSNLHWEFQDKHRKLSKTESIIIGILIAASIIGYISLFFIL